MLYIESLQDLVNLKKLIAFHKFFSSIFSNNFYNKFIIFFKKASFEQSFLILLQNSNVLLAIAIT